MDLEEIIKSVFSGTVTCVGNPSLKGQDSVIEVGVERLDGNQLDILRPAIPSTWWCLLAVQATTDQHLGRLYLRAEVDVSTVDKRFRGNFCEKKKFRD